MSDHNTISHHRLLAELGNRYRVALLPAQEVTTDTGHANAFGDIGWVDFRLPARDWVSAVEQSGGLLSVNHPLAADCCWRQPLPVHPPLAEIWHASWLDRRWGGPISWWQAWGSETTPIGGSDFHSPEQGRPLGVPLTWLLVDSPRFDEDPTGALTQALRSGRTAICAAAAAPLLLRVGDELVALQAAGSMLVDRYGVRTPVPGDRASFPAGAGPYRLDGHDGELIAIAN